MNVVFRVDASSRMGSGHVMRCLTLAQALCERDAACTFICRELDGNLISLIKERGFTVFILPNYKEGYEAQEGDVSHAGWLGCDWQTDASETQTRLEKLKPDWLIVDHYAIDTRWELYLRDSYTKLMVIDDIADRTHTCDVLLDQNLIEGMEERYTSLVPEHATLLLGPHFALLHSEYARLHETVNLRSGQVQRVFIYFGGADTHNLLNDTLEAFSLIDTTNLTIDVVVPHKCELAGESIECVMKCENMQVHAGLSDLSNLMSNADLAVGSCGTTSLERCCLGLPSIVITLADNQRKIAEGLQACKAIHWIGHVDTVSVVDIRVALEPILQNELDPNWSARCIKLVDGLGVSRVVTFLLLSSNTKLTTRAATLNDELLLLRWANDPTTRQHAFNSKAISKDEHNRWFQRYVQNTEDGHICIVTSKYGDPIGQVRFDLAQGAWTLDYAVAPHLRGQGLGAQVLQAALYEFQTQFPNSTVIGEVKKSNMASVKVFESLHFLATPSENSQSITFIREPEARKPN
jgi:UDP-2,4-diacetamido-2,4,6-trideoxy-beta-L-altropyranose hydrolase